MAGIMATVDQRTKMVGQNRIELLMFKLNGSNQTYGINVFKVREVTACPKLTVIPSANPAISGIADFRGKTIPVIDFSMAIGGKPTDNPEQALVIISEYSRSVQALIVSSVDRIINMSWDKIKPPPVGAGGIMGHYLTAIAEVDEKLVEIIDVERILSEVQPSDETVEDKLKEEVLALEDEEIEYTVLVADDSAVARGQIQKCMTELGIHTISFPDGQQALDFLKAMVADGRVPSEELLMVISDVEMPVMDGYTFATEVRTDESLKDLYVALHTSLSGVFNEALVQKVGADKFIAKFQPNVLAKTVEDRVEAAIAKRKAR